MKVPSDLRKLKEWFKTAHLDPNDPSNVALFELLKVRDQFVARFRSSQRTRLRDYSTEGEHLQC